MRRRWPWAVGVVVACAAVIALVLHLTGYLWVNPSVTNKPIGEGVTVTTKHVRKGLNAKLAKDATLPPFRMLNALTPVLDIGPTGKLDAPMTVTLTLDQPVQQGDLVVIAVNHARNAGGWELQPATIKDSRHVVFTVSELSWFQALWSLTKDILNVLKNTFLDGMTSGVIQQTDKPTCQNEQGARGDNYSITSDSKDTLFWCLELQGNGDRLLKVSNNRRYPEEVNLANLTVVRYSNRPRSLDLGELARLGHHTIIMPHDQATFKVANLPMGGKATLNAQLSEWALGLQVVQVLAETVITLATHTNVGAAMDKLDLTDKVLGAKGCLGVMGNPLDVGNMIKSCFNEDILKQGFGWRATILAPVMLAFSLINMTQAVANAFGDSRNGRANYGITISRQQNPLAGLVGTWTDGNSPQQVTLKITSPTTGTLDYMNLWGDPGSNHRLHYDLSLRPNGSGAVATTSNMGCFTGPADNPYPTAPSDVCKSGGPFKFPANGSTVNLNLVGGKIQVVWNSSDWYGPTISMSRN